MALTQHSYQLTRQLFRNMLSSQRVICSATLQTKLYNSNKLDDTRQSPYDNKKHFSVSVPKESANLNKVKVTFVRTDGQRITVYGKIGDNLLDVVLNNNVDLDGFGACEGTLACSTCHLIFSKQDYDKIPEKPTDEELDMLDLASELTDTSRLGCQVFLTKDFDGLEVRVPTGVNDART